MTFAMDCYICLPHLNILLLGIFKILVYIEQQVVHLSRNQLEHMHVCTLCVKTKMAQDIRLQ